MATHTMLAPRAAYALWSDVYPAVAHNPLMRTEQQVVLPLIESARPTRALDVGTGTGRYLPLLARAGARTAVALDFSREMLARISQHRAPKVCADARHLPFAAGSFDLVNGSLMAGDIADLSPWLREIARVLAPAGHLVYSDFHPSWAKLGWRRTFQTARGDTIDLPYEPHTLDDHLAAVGEAGFRLLACYELPLAEGEDSVRAFRQRWGNPPVLVVLFAQKTPCGGV